MPHQAPGGSEHLGKPPDVCQIRCLSSGRRSEASQGASHARRLGRPPTAAALRPGRVSPRGRGLPRAAPVLWGLVGLRTRAPWVLGSPLSGAGLKNWGSLGMGFKLLTPQGAAWFGVPSSLWFSGPGVGSRTRPRPGLCQGLDAEELLRRDLGFGFVTHRSPTSRPRKSVFM